MNAPTIKRHLLLRTLRNYLVLAIAIGVMLDRFGIPYLRVNYTYNETYGVRHYTSCRYWSIAGGRQTNPPDNYPVVIFLPLDKPVIHYVKSVSLFLWQQISTPSPKP